MTEVRVPEREEFYEIDRHVRGLAFGIQNEMGRLLEEQIYQAAVQDRVEASGMECSREVEIRLHHEAFSKSYFLDFLVNRSVIVETKCVESISKTHESQVIQYLHLADLPFASVPNFRTPKVEHRFVTSTRSAERRRSIQVEKENWPDSVPCLRDFEQRILALTSDWGTYLSNAAYEAALRFFFAGNGRIPIHSRRTSIGSQAVNLLTEDISFTVTSLASSGSLQSHLERFLTHTSLQGLAWVNLHHETVQLRYLKNQ